MLAEVYGGPNNASGNGYMYHYLLDEMMRRGQIGVSAAAKVLVDAQSGGTHAICLLILHTPCLTRLYSIIMVFCSVLRLARQPHGVSVRRVSAGSLY